MIKKEMTMKFWRIYDMFWLVPSRQTQIPPWYHDMVLATCRSKQVAGLTASTTHEDLTMKRVDMVGRYVFFFNP